MEKKKLVPQIRFKGFNDEWMQKTLEDISTYKASTYNINSALKYGKYSIFDANNFIGYVNKYLCNKDYIAIIKDGSGAGRTIYMKAYSNFIGTMGGIIPNNNINPNFLYSLINTINFKQYIKGATIPHIYYSDYNKHFIFITTIEEQQKIGHYFYKLDEYINLNKKKIKKISNIKNALLQKMFPNGDSKVPEIRFKGFTGNWEKKKLGDIVEIIMGQSPKSTHYSDKPIGKILVQGNADIKDGFVIPRIWTTHITKMALKDDLIMSVRAPAGAMGKTSYDIVLGRGVAAIKGNEYIYQLLVKMYNCKYWNTLSTGSTFDSLSSSTITNAIISFTTLNEQNKIGIIFQKMDTLIKLYNKKIEKLTNLKKAFLKKMFV